MWVNKLSSQGVWPYYASFNVANAGEEYNNGASAPRLNRKTKAGKWLGNGLTLPAFFIIQGA